MSSETPAPASTSRKDKYIWGTGRRKTAVARVRIIEGSGKIVVNDKTVEEFFTEEKHRQAVYAPFHLTDTVNRFDVFVRTNGGGIAGQAGATLLGISRALRVYNLQLDKVLRDAGFLTRDSRMKERKKYGQKGARKRFQFSKR